MELLSISRIGHFGELHYHSPRIVQLELKLIEMVVMFPEFVEGASSLRCNILALDINKLNFLTKAPIFKLFLTEVAHSIPKILGSVFIVLILDLPIFFIYFTRYEEIIKHKYSKSWSNGAMDISPNLILVQN